MMNAGQAKIQKGCSGNPNGRPKGSRNKLSEKFLADVAKDWNKHGKEVLENVCVLQPGIYFRIVASLISKGVAEDVPHAVEHSDDSAKQRLLNRLMMLAENEVET